LNLANSIKTTNDVIGSAGQVILDVKKLMEEDPYFAVLGLVISMVKFFSGDSKFDEIMAELFKIE